MSYTPPSASNMRGTFANRPTAGRAGRIYVCSDVAGLMWYDNGTAWQPILDGRLGTQPPAASNWTQVGTATLSDSYGRLRLTQPSANSASTNRRLAYVTAPSTPFTLTCGMKIQNAFPPALNHSLAGIFYRQSDGKFITMAHYVASGASPPRMEVAKYTNATTYSAAYRDAVHVLSWPISRIYFHLTDPGSGNLTWAYSFDGDVANATTYYNQATRTDFLSSASQIGFFIDPCNTDATYGKAEILIEDWTTA